MKNLIALFGIVFIGSYLKAQEYSLDKVLELDYYCKLHYHLVLRIRVVIIQFFNMHMSV